MSPKKKVPKRIPMEDTPSENTKRATKALRPLQPVDPVDPDELEALPDEIPRDSDSGASSMGPPGTAAPSKKMYILHCFTSERVNLYQNMHECVII